MNQDAKMPKEPTHCYKVGDMVFVPHYTRKVYVGPGYFWEHSKAWTADELVARGATTTVEFLWSRHA